MYTMWLLLISLPVKDVCCGLIDQRFSDLLLMVAIETAMPFVAKWCCSHLVGVGQELAKPF